MKRLFQSFEKLEDSQGQEAPEEQEGSSSEEGAQQGGGQQQQINYKLVQF
jgi:hypothetical protein